MLQTLTYYPSSKIHCISEFKYFTFIPFFTAFVFLSGHASLVSHLVMYFPDIMRRLFKKNPDFEDNAKWAIRYTAEGRLVNEEKTLEILNLVS